MADVKIEEILCQPEHFVAAGEATQNFASTSPTASEQYVSSAQEATQNFVSTSPTAREHYMAAQEAAQSIVSTLSTASHDNTGFLKEADCFAESGEVKEDKTEESEEQVEGENDQWAVEMVSTAAVMDNFYVDDLETISASDIAGYFEESSADWESKRNLSVAAEDENFQQDLAETASNKSRSRTVFSGIDSEENLFNEEISGFMTTAEEEEEDIMISNPDMTNAHYLKLNAVGNEVERYHDADMSVENTVRAEAMREAETSMAFHEEEASNDERKVTSKESGISLEMLGPNLVKEAGDGATAYDGRTKDGADGESKKTEFVSATIERLCYEMEDGVVWRKTHTTKRIRKKILSPLGSSNEEMFM